MTWVFILGILYGLIFALNAKFCRRSPSSMGLVGSVAGILVTGLSTLVALGPNGASLSPKDWLLPFLAMCFFFMPNYTTGVGLLLDHRN